MTDQPDQPDDGNEEEEYISRREAEQMIDERIREFERDLSRAVRDR